MKEKDNVVNKSGKGKTITIVIMGAIIAILVAILLIVLLDGKKSNSSNKIDNNFLGNKENSKNNDENIDKEKNNDGDIEKDNKDNGNDKGKNCDCESSQKPSSNDISIPEMEFGHIACGGVSFDFKKSTVTVDKISTSDKLGMLSTVLLEMVGKDKLRELSEDKDLVLDFNILEVANKYFDVTPEMKKQMEEGFGSDFYLFKYKDNKSILHLVVGGCTSANDGDYVKLKEIKKENNTLIKTYYYYYLKGVGEPVVVGKSDGYGISTFPFSYYKDENAAKPLYEEVVSESIVNFDEFDTYDVYFDISNGNMKLTKIVYNAK